MQLKFLRTEDDKLIPHINEFTDYQIERMTPTDFNESSQANKVRAIEASFETLCTNLEELGVSNPKQLTVFEFYSKIRYFKAKNKT